MLALKFKKTVACLKYEMDSDEFEEWKYFYSIRPFGDEWDDYRFGTLAANIMASLAGVPDGMRHDKFIETCMPLIVGRDNKWRGKTTPEEQIAILSGMRP